MQHISWISIKKSQNCKFSVDKQKTPCYNKIVAEMRLLIIKEVIIITNVNKLKGIIKEKQTTPEKVAMSIGIDKSTMYRKLNNGGDEFTIKQADAISLLLGLTAEEAQAIFFSQYVA